tara:strand:+ start:205 stop:453 length:249 start_codon:yes stop_codon:yes gene_type:complete
MLKLRILKDKALRKINTNLMRNSTPINQKIGITVLHSRVDYRGKDNPGTVVIRNPRTKPPIKRLNGHTYQGMRKSYGCQLIG